ncbi:MAG: hypothetical protein EP329_27550 [Deltaproteobacteria bacterium]|nr:MAG: hypothetical protein EP329_27550 [Deltaproteobacteria bacterium]
MTPTFARSLAVLLLLTLLAGCGADSAGSLNSEDTQFSDTSATTDIIQSTDTTTASDTTTTADTGIPEDTAAADTAREDTQDADTTTLTKADPTFIVPAGVAERREVALSGTEAAWVERDTPGALPRLVSWSFGDADAAPVAHAVANLAHPRELARDGDLLVYVDDRYGDADVFALDLTTGVETAIATRIGAQTRPDVRGRRVVWQDCRRCVSGEDDHKADVFLLDLDSGVETNLTDDDTADRRPVFGTLSNGAVAVAWVHAGGVLRASALDGTDDVAWSVSDVELGGLALTEGVFAWRKPSPFIINPDSMRPGDVFLTAASDGATFPATQHAERAAGLDEVPRAAAGHFTWLSSPPNDPTTTRLRVAGTDATALAVEDLPARATSFATSASHAAVTAVRADNGGFDDVWILPLGP